MNRPENFEHTYVFHALESMLKLIEKNNEIDKLFVLIDEHDRPFISQTAEVNFDVNSFES